MAEEEAAIFHAGLELLIVVTYIYVGVAECLGLEEDVLLNVLEQVHHVFYDAVKADGRLFKCVATHNLDSILFVVASTHNQTHGHTLQFVVGKLEARALVVGVIILDADTEFSQLVDHGAQLITDGLQLFAAFADRYDNHLDRSELRRKYQSVVVAVGHDERTDKAGRHTPGGSPYILRLVILVQEGNVKRLGEVLTQEVAGSALQSLAVLHHCFDGIGVQCACKALGFALYALEYRYAHPLFCEIGIYMQHLLSLFFSLLASGVGSMSFLPQEFRCAQEWTRAHFPSHYVTPLVAHQW